MKIAIFVGRFQTPKLHNGYKYILSKIQIEYDHYGIIIGSSKFINKDNRNPLSFEIRKAMLEKYIYKSPLFISELVDLNNSNEWNNELDKLISNSLNQTNNTEIDIVLIGSRDSFINKYNGKYKTFELKPFGNFNSTELRTNITFNFYSFEFIKGYIFGFIEKNFKHKFKWLEPINKYNTHWSQGYILSIKK